METHFDTQIIIMDRIEVILEPKSGENLSNADFGSKSTEMLEKIVIFSFKIWSFKCISGQITVEIWK